MLGTTAPSAPRRPVRRLCAVALALASGPPYLSPYGTRREAAGRVRRGGRSGATPSTSFPAWAPSTCSAPTTALPAATSKGWDSGVVRMERVVGILGDRDLDVVGLPGVPAAAGGPLRRADGHVVADLPRAEQPGRPSVNSIGWDTVGLAAPRGPHPPDPLLRRRAEPDAGRAAAERRTPVAACGSSTPTTRADVRGPGAAWRDAGVRDGGRPRQRAARPLTRTRPSSPWATRTTGRGYYCSVAPGADMWSASGGFVDGTHLLGALLAGRSTGSWDPRTSSSTATPASSNDYVAQTSDHPLYYANVVVPASAPPASTTSWWSQCRA